MLFRVILKFLANPRSAKAPWKDVLCTRFYSYKGRAADVLRIQEQHETGQKQDRNGVLVTEHFAQVNVIYESSDRMTLNDAQDTARVALMENQGNGTDGHIFDSNEYEAELAEKLAWYFNDLRDSGRQGTPASQAIHGSSMKYEIKEASDLAGPWTIIDDGISFIEKGSRANGSARRDNGDLPAFSYKREKNIVRLHDLASQQVLLKRKIAGTLAHASGAVVSLGASPNGTARRCVIFLRSLLNFV